jgi:type IV pilus assembly protein PilF
MPNVCESVARRRGRERRPAGRRWRALLVVMGAAASAFACAHSPSAKEREAAEIHYQLGAEALRAGRREEAMREFNEALRADDGHAAAHLGRGLAFQFFGKPEEAERDYRRAIEIDPHFSDAHNALGQLLAVTNRLQQALPEFDLAIENMMYREAYVARCNKGAALIQLGRRDEGLAEIRQCLALAPRYCRGHRELGRIQLEEGRVKEALDSFGRYTQYCEAAPDAWFQLGVAEMKAGDPDKAREAFEKCVGVGRDDPLVEDCRRKVKALQ